MTSKYCDTSACMQVIGDVFMNPSLLDLEDKYKFNEVDFPQEFHRILFGSIYNLHQLGVKQISIEDIEKYLEQRPKKYAVYKVNKGSEYLMNLKEMCQLAAFDYYYNRMKKMTLLRMYNTKAGMDLSWLYDPDNVLDAKKKEAQETWFDNTPINEIADTINNKIDEIKSKYVDNSEDGVIQAGDGALSLLNRLKNNPEIGYPLYGKFVNTIHRGARLKKFYLRSSATGIGKAIPNSTVIPTMRGDKKVCNITRGEYIFDALGRPTQVLGVFPQGEKIVWEITFKDGRKAQCSGDHLWAYYKKNEKRKRATLRKRNFSVATTKELYNQEFRHRDDGAERGNIMIPMQQPLQYERKVFHIQPYTLGLLISSETSLNVDENHQELAYISEDESFPLSISEEMDWDIEQVGTDKWKFIWKDGRRHHGKRVLTEEVFNYYKDFINSEKKDRYIPPEFLEGSIEQRFDLLNGLLDADGYIKIAYSQLHVLYIAPNERIKDDIFKLARSLGFIPSVTTDKRRNIHGGYLVEIQGTMENKHKLFYDMERKNQIFEFYKNRKYDKENHEFNYIVDIRQLKYKVPMTCFYVDNEEHLFLMNDFIVTHNTRSMIADACTIACDKIYNLSEKTWEDNGTQEPTQFITTEQEEDEIQTMMISFLSAVNEDHILSNTYYGDEWERVKEAADILSKSPLYIKKLPDFSLQDIENTIKYGIRQYDIRYIFMDYIHSSMKILSEISSKAGVKGLREDNILFMISVRLKDLCNQYGVFIMSATQLNSDYVTAQRYDQNLLRGAKSIAD